MRRVRRAVKGRFGMTAPRLAVRASVAWYWRVLQVAALLGAGYLAGYWQFSGRFAFPLDRAVADKLQDTQVLQSRLVQLERQLQVANAAQGTMAKEMAVMQDEDLRLKEDVAFYKSILAESGAAGVPRIHSVKLSRGAHPAEYRYQILLVQSGRHDKQVQGMLQLSLSGTQEGRSLSRQVGSGLADAGLKVNFKYYQRLEGVFSVPPQMQADSLQVQYLAAGGKTPPLSQTVSLPN